MCVENKKKTLEEFKCKKYRVNDEVKWDQMVILMSVLLVLWHANSYCALPAAARLDHSFDDCGVHAAVRIDLTVICMANAR